MFISECMRCCAELCAVTLYLVIHSTQCTLEAKGQPADFAVYTHVKHIQLYVHYVCAQHVCEDKGHCYMRTVHTDFNKRMFLLYSCGFLSLDAAFS